MAINDITYGTPAALVNISRLHSNTSAVAEAFGEIVSGGELSNNILITVPISASATAGTYDLYLVESQDGATWTDNIDPATSGDVKAKISDAKFLKSISTIYDGTNRTEAVFSLVVPMLTSAKYIGFVLDNLSLQTIPASGASGDSVTFKIASA